MYSEREGSAHGCVCERERDYSKQCRYGSHVGTLRERERERMIIVKRYGSHVECMRDKEVICVSICV